MRNRGAEKRGNLSEVAQLVKGMTDSDSDHDPLTTLCSSSEHGHGHHCSTPSCYTHSYPTNTPTQNTAHAPHTYTTPPHTQTQYNTLAHLLCLPPVQTFPYQGPMPLPPPRSCPGPLSQQPFLPNGSKVFVHSHHLALLAPRGRHHPAHPGISLAQATALQLRCQFTGSRCIGTACL